MKEKNKYFVFSDVHGEYDALMESLQEAGYNSRDPKHVLVSCGDNFDRGPDSRKIYSFLSNNNTIAVKGNHDAMFEEFLDKGMDGEFVLFNILHNGLGATIASFSNEIEDRFNPSMLGDISQRLRGSQVHRWIKKMPLYFETENFVFCHAGIDPREEDWENTEEDFMLWDIEYSHRPISNVNKIVVIGHHHAFRVRQNAKNDGERENRNWTKTGTNTFSCFISNKPILVHTYGNTDENAPFFNSNKIAIDGCSNLTKKVNVLVVEDYPKQEEKEKAEEQNITTVNVDNHTCWGNININLSNDIGYYTTTITDAEIATHTHGTGLPF